MTEPYKYYTHEGNLFREDPETLDMEYWTGDDWSDVLGVEDVTVSFDGVPLTSEAAKKLMVKH